MAVSGDRRRWFLLNASPDLREQISHSEFLHPREGLRSSPIGGVVLTGADVDCIAGLLSMRERQPFTLYATRAVHDVLAANPIFEVLDRQIVQRQIVAMDIPVKLDNHLSIELFGVPGKVPLYLEETARTPVIETSESTVGVAVSDGRHTLYYIPACAMWSDALEARLRNADLVYFDGTLWSDDEMITAGLSTKTGQRMGHISVSGPEGTLAKFEQLNVRRKVLIHINNSNPVLIEDSPERETLIAAGWEVAYDGLEVVL